MWAIYDIDNGRIEHLFFNTEEDAKAYLWWFVEGDPEQLKYYKVYKVKETTDPIKWVTVRKE